MVNAIDEFNNGHYEECIGMCSKEIDDNRPFAAEARNLRGSLYMLRCQYKEALEDFERLLDEESPTSAATLCYEKITTTSRSHENGEDEEEDEAAAANKARDFNNRRLKSNALIKLTALNLQNSQETEAFDNYKRAIEIDPTNEDIYCNRAQVFAMKNRFEESFKDFDKVLGKLFGLVIFLYNLSYISIFMIFLKS